MPKRNSYHEKSPIPPRFVYGQRGGAASLPDEDQMLIWACVFAAGLPILTVDFTLPRMVLFYLSREPGPTLKLAALCHELQSALDNRLGAKGVLFVDTESSKSFSRWYIVPVEARWETDATI